ncbi:molybdopterin-guanine dinucleotide biosynthesis protein B [Paenibacillus sp. N3.4]|uniref:molybdopterin-guanine dinucleotide biosynthesis protein B n=1 Tax=Paenibacillus sp. N3.4 TaxID=2603222 RepID=UPI0011C746BD|nr:molybdopterin-guanine dinucleotide biosynthesis protein B [Paenibacillus sp. N3.4]TXK86033.1 molybdopterin-guanine dinucleotide biosynthesis protein B [Paenibacillus sp. N3.4]
MAYCMGFAGYSGSGKTTLVTQLVVEMKRRGFRVAVIKHDAHGHYKEAAGADSTLFIEAGADAVVTISPNQVNHVVKQQNTDLQEELKAYTHVDYIFVEGFKMEKHPKIAVFRTIEQSEIIPRLDPKPVAIATDLNNHHLEYIALDLNDICSVADFVEQFFVVSPF